MGKQTVVIVGRHAIKEGEPVLVTTGRHNGMMLLCEACARASLAVVKDLARHLEAEEWPKDKVMLGKKRIWNR